MACNPYQVGLFDDFCSCLTEIEDKNSRYLKFSKCGLTETNTALCSQIPGPKVLVWTDSSDWTNLNLRANQNARRINSGPGIFIIDFRPIFWECTAFLLMKRKLCSSLLVEHLQTQLGHLRPQAVYWTLFRYVTVVCNFRCKHFDFDSYRRIRPIRE